MYHQSLFLPLPILQLCWFLLLPCNFSTLVDLLTQDLQLVLPAHSGVLFWRKLMCTAACLQEKLSLFGAQDLQSEGKLIPMTSHLQAAVIGMT